MKIEFDNLDDFISQVKRSGAEKVGIRALTDQKAAFSTLIRLTASHEDDHFLFQEVVFSGPIQFQDQMDKQMKALEAREEEITEILKDKLPKVARIRGQILP